MLVGRWARQGAKETIAEPCRDYSMCTNLAYEHTGSELEDPVAISFAMEIRSRHVLCSV